MRIVMFLLLGGFVSAAGATEYMKVLKVKGTKAIVKLPDTNFQKGQQVAINRGIWGEGMQFNGRRKYRAEVEAALGTTSLETESSSSTTDASATVVDIDILFGFNKESFEYGPIVGYESTADDDDDQSSVFMLGGFLEYNFAENIKGETLVPFVGARALYINTANKTSTSDVKGSGFGYGLEAGVKLFPFNDHFFVKTSVLHAARALELDNDTKQSLSSTALTVGLGAYF